MTPLRPGLHGRSVLRTPDCRAHRLRRARWLRGARHLQGNRIGSQGQPARAQPRLRESRACAAQGENRFPFLSPSPRGQPATCARSGAPTQPQAQPRAPRAAAFSPFGCLISPPSPIRRNAPPVHPLRKHRGAPDVRARPSASPSMHELQRLHQILGSRDDAPVRRAPHPVGFSRPRASTRPFPTSGAQLAGLREAMRRKVTFPLRKCPNA